jgi:hypothetical protein
MTIYEALSNDHTKVQDLLKELVALSDKDFARRNVLLAK